MLLYRGIEYEYCTQGSNGGIEKIALLSHDALISMPDQPRNPAMYRSTHTSTESRFMMMMMMMMMMI